MADKNEKVVAKKEETGLAVPDYVEQEQKGTESLNSKDVVIPRLKLVQGLSAEKIDDGIAEGNFVNAITKEDYGSSIEISIIMVTTGWVMFEGEGRAAKVVSRKFKGDIIPSLNPDICMDPENQKWIDNKPPKANQVYTYILMVNGRDLLSYSLMKTAVKAARQLNTMLKMKGKVPSYSMKFKVESLMTKTDKGAFFSPKFTPSGWVDKVEYIGNTEKYESLSMQNLQVEVEDTSSQAGEEENKEI